MELWRLGAARASAKMARGELSSGEYTRAFLARIDEREGSTRAWAHVDREHALAQACRRDGEPRRRPLHGIPVGLKDVIGTRDLQTRHNSPIFAGHRPNEDAYAVATVLDLPASCAS